MNFYTCFVLPFCFLWLVKPVHCITIIFIIANGFVSVSTYRSVENDRNLRIKCCFTLGIFFKQGYLSFAITELYTLLIVCKYYIKPLHTCSNLIVL